ncbi:DUF1998 domain-containing protein [Amycolatopsis eburnea]|nr:DUF1998 domain-containing protein [Amycolatopsis eburnea]
MTTWKKRLTPFGASAMSTRSQISTWSDEMPLRRPNIHGRSAASKGLLFKTPLGAVRNAQVVMTYGVGSMVAVDDNSFIVSGLDTWSIDSAHPLYEPRLQRRLGVRVFRSPPPADTPPAGDGVRIRRFPEIYSCPGCSELKKFKYFGTTTKSGRCADCDRRLVPSRFVVACEKGHLDDFPYWQWVHKRNAPAGEVGDRHDLTLSTDGRTASLRSVVINCSCGLASSMEGAFGSKALHSLGVACSGRRPWLGEGAGESGCDAVPRTLQRGASAAWFSVTRSSLSIPPWSDTLQKLVDKEFSALDVIVAQAGHADVIRHLSWVKEKGFTVGEVVEAVERRRQFSGANADDAQPESILEAAESFRIEEYPPLYHGHHQARQGDDFECVRPEDVDDVELPGGIDRVMLVKRLREVRALEAFTRVEAPEGTSDRQRFAHLSRSPVDWLPAVEVSGEGVFVALDPMALARWETSDVPVRRGAQIRKAHTDLLRRRAVRRGDPTESAKIESPISTRYILLHTLAHALINEWSLDAGYPAAALRERLYVSDQWAGLLIYTATSDSAGSLGGVVAQGSHARLGETLRSALDRISWCSQDPPCMESEASGTDSLNLAACYACVMLPESSCETNNSFLDRALLVGQPGEPRTGYFEHLLGEGR